MLVNYPKTFGITSKISKPSKEIKREEKKQYYNFSPNSKYTAPRM